MLRTFMVLATLGVVLLVGGCNSDDETATVTIPTVAGTWKMVANTNFDFDLVLLQSDGTITGTMTRTNGTEPVDNVAGTVEASGAITFIRTRSGTGGWTQTYTGTVNVGTVSVMSGTFTTSNSATVATWTATK